MNNSSQYRCVCTCTTYRHTHIVNKQEPHIADDATADDGRLHSGRVPGGVHGYELLQDEVVPCTHEVVEGDVCVCCEARPQGVDGGSGGGFLFL
jgi:hypothetical protein